MNQIRHRSPKGHVMRNAVTPVTNEVIDRLLDQIFKGDNHPAALSVSAHRNLLEGADDCASVRLAAQHLCMAVALTSLERAHHNDTNGIRRRARETKERHELL
jgi:hypothetical protein